jgi:hypothetical protein
MRAHVSVSFSILLLIMSTVVPSEAALLESPKQLITRYGKPFKVDFGGSVYLFRTRAFTINVNFIEGKSRSETYLPRTRRGLTEREIDSFLQLNSLGSIWRPAPDQGGWRLSSGKALARLTGLNAPWPNLHVLTSDYEFWPPKKT